MNHQMPQLPYPHDSLEPVISNDTIYFHYGKHLQTYINNLNNLVKGTPFEDMKVEEIVKSAPDGALFNNAGQVLNHTLYFKQFTPLQKHKEPKNQLAEAIIKSFGSFEQMKKQMEEMSVNLFGSGWVWLCAEDNDNLQLTPENNGCNPIRHGKRPLLGFDVWEHAYYLDYQNRRADHIKNLWEIIDWTIVEQLYS